VVRKLGLLTSLYLAQGLPYGFFTQALPAMLRQQGVSLEKIGLASLLALPWGLKFLWAPAVDRLGSERLGRRRSWILPLQGLAIVVLILLSGVDPSAGLTPILVGVYALNLVAATQDIATDGLAVSILSHDERGLGNGIQVAGYRLGMIIGGGVLLIVFERLGWTNVFLLMAAVIFLTTLPIAAYREPKAAPAGPKPSLGRAVIVDFLGRPGMLRWLGVIAALKAGEHLATAMLRPFFIDRGLDLEAIGWLTGTAGFIAGLAGAMAGGALVRPLGRYRALMIFGVLEAITVAAYALATFGPLNLELLYGLCIAEHFVGGMVTVSLFTLMMDACRKGMAGTEYTIQASVYVLAAGAVSGLSGFVAASIGYTWHFVVSGVACLLMLIPLILHVAAEQAGASKVMVWTEEPEGAGEGEVAGPT
jgi:RhtX/FptX family siderophore transporter